MSDSTPGCGTPMYRFIEFFRSSGGNTTVNYAVVLGMVVLVCLTFRPVRNTRLTFSTVSSSLGADSPVESVSESDAPVMAPAVASVQSGREHFIEGLAGLACFVALVLVFDRRWKQSVAKAEEEETDSAEHSEFQNRLFSKRQAIFRSLSKDTGVLLESRLRVSQVMTHYPIIISTSTPIDEVRELMRKKKLRHILVGSEERLRGVISDRDLAVRDAKEAGDMMTADPVTVSSDTLLSRAITSMVDRRFSCLPVMEEHRVVGVVTSTDMMMILQCCLRLVDQIRKEVLTPEEIEQTSLVMDPPDYDDVMSNLGM